MAEYTEKINYHKQKLQNLKNERSKWEPAWKDIRRYIWPYSGNFLGEQGQKRTYHDERLDNVATEALDVLASGMHSGLTTPNRKWFSLTLKYRPLTENDAVKLWLEEAQEQIMSILAGSNAYTVLHQIYKETGAYGTGTILIEEDAENVIRCRHLTVGEYYIATDAKGIVDTLYREVKMTARQMLQRFTDKVPQVIADKAKSKTTADSTFYDVIHVIERNENWDKTKFQGEFRQFKSLYILLSHEETILEFDGFNEFPAACLRWEVIGSDSYGVSPAFDAMPNVKTKDRIRGDSLDALALEVKPPMNVSSDLKNQGLQFGLKPGFANFVNTSKPLPDITPTYQVKSNLQAARETIEDYKQQIRETFHFDVFQAIAMMDKGMTATEVIERVAEKMVLLGPIVERARHDLLFPFILRVFNIMYRLGRIPPAPEEIQGEEWDIDIISMLTQAQKADEVKNIRAFTMEVLGLAQANPEILDVIDFDSTARHLGNLMNIPNDIIHDEKFVQGVREQRQQQMQAEQQAMQAQAMMAQGADATQKLSNVDMKQDTAAAQMLKNMGMVQ